jgi:cysteine desulfurase
MLCPMPLVKLSKAMKGLQAGEILGVIADVECFDLDVKAWCDVTGNPLLAVEHAGEATTAYIQKA